MSRSELVVRCRGLPFTCTDGELREFFGNSGITFVKMTQSRDGRPSGEAFVTFDNDIDYQNALKKDKQNLGHRYIEVFSAGAPGAAGGGGGAANYSYGYGNGGAGAGGGYSSGGGGGYGGGRDYNSSSASSAPQSVPEGGYVVKLRGLPFNTGVDEITNFFAPLVPVQDGVIVPNVRNSRGEAFVIFGDQATAQASLEKHMKNIQHRYIEVFTSTHEEIQRSLSGDSGPGAGYGGGRGGGYGGRGGRAGPYDRPSQQGGGDYGYGYGGAGAYDAYGYGGRGYDYSAAGYGAESGGDYAGYQGYQGYYDGSYGYGSYEQQGQAQGGPMRAQPRGAGAMRPADGDGDRTFILKMRGIPFRATESEIYEFFKPINPCKVEILRENGNGRPSGEARVEFSTRAEYDEALGKDKAYMGSRYVELFPDHSQGRF